MTPADRLRAIQDRIGAAERAAGRPPGSVSLLAVSKGVPATDIRALAAVGQRLFGESYLSEAAAKFDALADLVALEWHYIGPLQSNKTREIALRFDWVHSIDRARMARRLSDQRPADRPPLNICIQVNISAEPTKSGIDPDGLSDLVRSVIQLPGLRLRGLMAIPAPSAEPAERRAAFRRLHLLQQRCIDDGVALDTLSMGMSDDLEEAIAEGATMVRIGTALFGPRR